MNAPIGQLLTLEQIQANLDATFPPLQGSEGPWDCLAGEAPVTCRHIHIDRAHLRGMAQVVCLSCGHEWIEHEEALP